MYTVAAYYRFFRAGRSRGAARACCAEFVGTDLLGTTLIAPEGINGTMAGSAETIDRLLAVSGGADRVWSVVR